MEKKAFSGLVLTLLLIGMSVLALSIQQVKVSAAESPYIAVVPESTVDTALTPGMNYTISIYTDYTGDDINGYGFELTYNPNVLEGIEVVNGDLIANPTMFSSYGFNNTAGRLRYTTNNLFFLQKPAPLTPGPGILANVTFRVVATGTSNITLEDQGMHGEHAYRTRLVGYTEGGYGDFYNIIDSATMPNQIQQGYFENGLPIHDVAVISVTPSPTEVVVGESVSISVIVENQGGFSETFDVSTFYDDTIIETQTGIFLEAGADTTLTFIWDTTGVAEGAYMMRAEASVVPDEIDTTDNVLVGDILVTVKMITSTISISVNPAKITVGEPITISGGIVPIRAGATVTIWCRLSGEPVWTILTTETTDQNSQYSHAWTPATAGIHELKASWSGDETTLPAESPVVTVEVRALVLSIELSGEHDYLYMERVKVRVAALVMDAITMEPISNADVTIEIYDAEGNLWVSGIMVEKIAGTGIYEWESEETIRSLRLEKGVYLAHASASYQGSLTASAILEFHIDPPQEQPIELRTILLVTIMGIVGIIATAWYMDHRRLTRKLYELQENKYACTKGSRNISTQVKEEAFS